MLRVVCKVSKVKLGEKLKNDLKCRCQRSLTDNFGINMLGKDPLYVYVNFVAAEEPHFDLWDVEKVWTFYLVHGLKGIAVPLYYTLWRGDSLLQLYVGFWHLDISSYHHMYSHDHLY